MATEATRPITILIVDDSAMMRMMIKRVAKLVDLPIGRILEAGDGRQALSLLEAEHVDALFTDINMPVMTGTELLREIAQRGAWPQMTRVIISTDGSAARREEGRALQVQHYIEKPFTPEALRDVLAAVTVAH